MSQQHNCLFCLKIITYYRNITDNLKSKIDNCSDKNNYKDLRVGVDKLCFECYMKIVDSHWCQIFTINKNNKSNNSYLIETNDLNESSKTNISTNLMNINNLIEIDNSTTLDLIETSDLIETNESEINNSANLIELIKAQKEDLIEINLNEINQQFLDIKVNITNNTVSIDLENFNQLIKLIIQKDLKIESLTNQNNTDQNQTELLILHIYDDAISEHKEERSMKNLKIIGIQKQNLHSTKDYLNVLDIITSIELLQQYLQNNIIPIIAD
ncbi:15087_t:CDS:2 [Dentiscutata erythropus]|uniref:15087_t:CDS:1 n=1 Tax=Dentiscutata erythropus TaxID=1348616 RepID=A0A9N9IST6_9GLOM|nr:15087_t:CDS:2 [Dentiscutata erythropus]